MEATIWIGISIFSYLLKRKIQGWNSKKHKSKAQGGKTGDRLRLIGSLNMPKQIGGDDESLSPSPSRSFEIFKL